VAGIVILRVMLKRNSFAKMRARTPQLLRIEKMDKTNDPQLQSFVPTSADSHFPIQNLPYGVFSRREDADPQKRIGVAIGDHILDLSILEQEGLFNAAPFHGKRLFNHDSLNHFMQAGRPAHVEARAIISRLLQHDVELLRDDVALRERALLPMQAAEMHLPVEIGDYTDFYSSREHATNVGTMFRGRENALMPNWLHMPVGYHGRASSVVLSGTDVRRPKGQIKSEDAALPAFGPSAMLDFELEMGCLVSGENRLGEPIPINDAKKSLFGMVLLNDWSARDIQKWEYVPLGPFLSKNFATSISPWVVTLDALEPFRVKGPAQNPEPLPYLRHAGANAYDIQLEVQLCTHAQKTPFTLSRSNTRYLYWSIFQYIAHHTATGCNLKTGDLFGSGTISGPTRDSCGSMLELAWRGTKPVALPDGEQRSFLQDGDAIKMTGFAQGDGYRIGFGEVAGKILPAL